MADTVDHLRSWTYERQRLGRAAPDAATALRDVIAVYSSHPSAPLSLHARTKDLTAAAFRELDVLRLPSMRQSLHLLPADTAHLAFRAVPEPAARSARRLKTFGLTDEAYAALRDAVLAATASQPRTAKELREATGAGKALPAVISMMSREGVLVRLGADGLRSNELRYLATAIAEADADEALVWLAGEYLRAFGPARAADFTWWAGTSAKRANQALAAVDTEELDRRLLIRAEDRAAFEKRRTAPSGAVDLLPKWDAYTMGFAPDGRDRFAHSDIVGDLYEKSGDGRPVILVEGTAAGVWSVKAGKGGAIEVELELFEKPAKKLQTALDERAEAVQAFLTE
jgi:winged helix DNA-binding protein